MVQPHIQWKSRHFLSSDFMQVVLGSRIQSRSNFPSNAIVPTETILSKWKCSQQQQKKHTHTQQNVCVCVCVCVCVYHKNHWRKSLNELKRKLYPSITVFEIRRKLRQKHTYIYYFDFNLNVEWEILCTFIIPFSFSLSFDIFNVSFFLSFFPPIQSICITISSKHALEFYFSFAYVCKTHSEIICENGYRFLGLSIFFLSRFFVFFCLCVCTWKYHHTLIFFLFSRFDVINRLW